MACDRRETGSLRAVLGRRLCRARPACLRLEA